MLNGSSNRVIKIPWSSFRARSPRACLPKNMVDRLSYNKPFQRASVCVQTSMLFDIVKEVGGIILVKSYGNVSRAETKSQEMISLACLLAQVKFSQDFYHAIVDSVWSHDGSHGLLKRGSCTTCIKG